MTSEETQEPEAQKISTSRRMVAAMSPRAVWSMADPYPVVIKQFVQFCLIIVYPAWIVGMLASLAIYGTCYGVLWVLFAPIRLWMKKNRPDEYAASQLK
ncbi:hypothetical protein [Mycobacterium sp. EPa45]|uniref:hypothetical protein n=1 Tax=Mycobacterium sp. EPa45 TaxID=1545728 RepID=UPI000A5F32B5|nr:hypothetical protein [Mycobacterium sp. EPa45]